MSIFEGIILGLLQGLTEFLPVSSSGHLALGRALFNNPALRESPLLFDVAVHAATLCAIVIYFRREVWCMIRGGVMTLLAVSKRFRPHPNSQAAADRRLFAYVVVASVPTAVGGLLLKDYVEGALQHPVPVGLLLCITGIILFVTRGFRGEGRSLKQMTAWDALIVGIAQTFAVLPGISRSGSTIGTAIVLGLRRKLAARFSFLIAVPAITGAAVIELPGLFSKSAGDLVVPTLLGALAAFISGYAAILLLIRVLEKRKLAWFAPYCWVVGILAIVLGLVYGS